MKIYCACYRPRQTVSIVWFMAMSVVSVGSGYVGASSVNPKGHSTPSMTSFTANYQLAHQPSGEVIARYAMTISENGFRFDEQGEGARASIILNTQLDKMWLLDRGLKVVHELPLQLKSASDSTNSLLDNDEYGDTRESGTGMIAGFIQFSPCMGMTAVPLPSKITGLDVFFCKVENNVVEKQWFDTEKGLVVKSESFDGMIATVTDIEPISSSIESLTPPSEYDKVGIEEMVPRKSYLDTYQEKNTLLHQSKDTQ